MTDREMDWGWREHLAAAMMELNGHRTERERIPAARKALRHVEVARTALAALVRRLEAEEVER